MTASETELTEEEVRMLQRFEDHLNYVETQITTEIKFDGDIARIIENLKKKVNWAVRLLRDLNTTINKRNTQGINLLKQNLEATIREIQKIMNQELADAQKLETEERIFEKETQILASLFNALVKQARAIEENAPG